MTAIASPFPFLRRSRLWAPAALSAALAAAGPLDWASPATGAAIESLKRR